MGRGRQPKPCQVLGLWMEGDTTAMEGGLNTPTSLDEFWTFIPPKELAGSQVLQDGGSRPGDRPRFLCVISCGRVLGREASCWPSVPEARLRRPYLDGVWTIDKREIRSSVVIGHQKQDILLRGCEYLLVEQRSCCGFLFWVTVTPLCPGKVGCSERGQ